MNREFLGERRRALEESFFVEHNRKLLDEFRAKHAATVKAREIADASGIHDEALLARLVDLGLCSETVAALTLVPLVEMAWADGKPPTKQREAVMSVAAEDGLEPGTPGYQLLENWLDQAPDAKLLTAWKDCVAVLVENMAEASRTVLREDLLRRARHVAEAAGGILGIGKISRAEQAMLDDLETALTK